MKINSEKIRKTTKRLVIRPMRASDFEVWKAAYLKAAPSKNRWDIGPRDESRLTRENFRKTLKNQFENRKNDRFEDLRLHRMEAGIEPNNRRSIALARSLGMRKEGARRRAIYLYKEWIDLVMYSVTCEDLKMPFRGELDFSRK